MLQCIITKLLSIHPDNSRNKMSNACLALCQISMMKLFENLRCCMTVVLEAVIRRCSVKKVFLKISQNSQENTCATVPFFFQTCIFIKKETLTHVFCCKFCDIFKNTFFYRTPLVALLFLKHWLGLEIKLKVFRWLTILQNNSSS